MLMLKMKQSYVVRIYAVLFIVVSLATATFIASSVSFAQPSPAGNWMTAQDFTLKLHANQDYESFYDPRCTYRDVQLHTRQFRYVFEGLLTPECVYEMGDWRYALTQYPYEGSYYYHYDARSFVINMDGSDRMYKVTNLTDHIKPIVVPNSKSIIKTMAIGFPGADGVRIYKNILERITPSYDETYEANLSSPDFTFKRDNGILQPVGRMAVSSNGKWLVFEAVNIGLVRLNLDTYEMKRFAPAMQLRQAGYDHFIRFDISADGSKVVVAGSGYPFGVYDINESCGDKNLTFYSDKLTNLATPCSMRHLGDELRKMQVGFRYIGDVEFQKDGDEMNIFLVATTGYGSYSSGKYTLRAKDNLPNFRLDYLALGDSFSSGEGDTRVEYGKKFYLPGTDVDGDYETPREKCHISSRSYPFFLKQAMNLSNEAMSSVACSGAEMGKDYVVDSDGSKYKGQNKRLSAYESDIVKLKFDALEKYIPGRVQQLEFIERYKPRAITITGGGNDVGFGEVIRSCILSNYYSCLYSSTESGKAAIGQGIANQYYRLNDLFARIKKISPDTKIYAVGYPQFVDDKSAVCALNVPISQSERKMINESVAYLNQVIKAAAIYSDVKFIDIENSLDGHKLCEKGTAYVTGLALARQIAFDSTVINHSELQESFHPNRNGHKLMADAIDKKLSSQSLMDYADYPMQTEATGPLRLVAPPEYFAKSMENATKSYRKDTVISRNYVQKSSSLAIFDIRFGGFAPNSAVKVENHSDPIVLGTYMADENGFLSADIAVPDNVPAGFHTLHLIGVSDSGENVDIWQGVEVRGVEGDIDEDGVADDVDGCLYVTEAGKDIDDDGIDDACDGMIDAIVQEEVLGDSNANKQIEPIAIEESQGNVGAGSIGTTTNQVRSMQNEVNKIFATPFSTNHLQPANSVSHVKGLHYVIAGAIVSIVILVWAIKGYSNSNRM